jgi:hypothetical protein
MVAVAGATLGGAYIGSKGAKSAADAGVAGQRDAMDAQERMFQESLSLQKPYREAGYGAIEGLQGMLDPAVRAESLNDYYQGPEYQALSDQASENILRAKSVTGGLRSGGTQAALAGIAPQLGMQHLASRQDQMTNIANMGMGAAAQGASGAQQLGTNLGINAANIGGIYGQQAQDQANIYSGALGTLGGLGMDYFNKPTGGQNV